MEQYMAYIWLAIAVVLAIAEICTTQLVSLWFVIGAVVAAVCAATFLNGQILLQVVVFIVVSAVALIATRPLVKKMKRTKKTSTNSDRNIGKTGTVIREINNADGTGLVNVDGEKWSARSADGSVIEADAAVTVEQISGVKLIVTRKETD